MKLIITTLLIASASAFAPAASTKSATSLKVSEIELGVTEPLGVYDPLGWLESEPEAFERRRAVERKHGRVAMAAFVGWWAVGSGLRFPGELAHGLEFSSIPSKGLEAWDAIPGWGKAQMLLFAGLIEFHDELFYSTRGTHYMRGGTPGRVRAEIVSTIFVPKITLT